MLKWKTYEMNRFVISDHHLGHENSLKLANRPFSTLEEQLEVMVERHNAVIKPQDKVYFLGDVAVKPQGLRLLSRFNGIKILIKGNHDRMTLKEYAKHFTDIRGCYHYNKSILTHIPVHPLQLEFRFKLNIHGHSHNFILDDKRYVNVCVEPLDYTPVNLDELIEQRLKELENESILV
jgi:calcineurin-like phosphoesterase family protein